MQMQYNHCTIMHPPHHPRRRWGCALTQAMYRLERNVNCEQSLIAKLILCICNTSRGLNAMCHIEPPSLVYSSRDPGEVGEVKRTEVGGSGRKRTMVKAWSRHGPEDKVRVLKPWVLYCFCKVWGPNRPFGRRVGRCHPKPAIRTEGRAVARQTKHGRGEVGGSWRGAARQTFSPSRRGALGIAPDFPSAFKLKL